MPGIVADLIFYSDLYDTQGMDEFNVNNMVLANSYCLKFQVSNKECKYSFDEILWEPRIPHVSPRGSVLFI